MAILSIQERLQAAFGSRWSDLRASLPQNPRGPAGAFSRRSIRGITTIAVHHSAGTSSQTWAQVAAYHVNSNKWAGIGYHIGIRQGEVSYLGDIGESRACCANQNDSVVCVCIMGNFETSQPSSADVAALERVVAELQAWARENVGHVLAVKGHREVPGQQTACPGQHLLPHVHRIARGGTVPAAGPVSGPGRNAIMQTALGARRLSINPESALMKAMTADGFVPTSDEKQHGEEYIVQLAGHGRLPGRVRAYFVRRGDWGNVGYYE